MMNKRIVAILLTICMLVGLLPTTALAAETGYLVTLDYDTSLCTVTVTDRNDSNATVAGGEYLTVDSDGAASAIFEIENIAEGYRIAEVLLNGVDYSVNFITGAYGGIARSGISEDVTLSVTLEEIPTLPVLESIEVYADETYTEVLSTDLILTEATQIYVKGTYADGGEYPEYTARGHMEYTMDGTTWNWTQWGGDYWYFPLNSTFYTDFNPLEDSYDFRICIEPDGLYCTGDTLYSEVYHVNGGAGSSESGDSGNSGSTDETTGYKLTLNYDAGQCSVKVTDKTTNTEVVNGGYVTIGTYGASMDIWVYVTEGYRIENVEFVDVKGTQDLTEHYIVGAYGWDPTLYAYSDCTLTITTDSIPSTLPTVTGVELYSDAARTEAMSSDVTLADGDYDVVYAKATYADGKEYPNYTARGTLEYTVDGVTWKEGVYGDGQIDFTLNSYADEYYNTGVKYTQYDYRIRFDPDNIYCTGESVYSEVYHVNGGVLGCNHSWDEGSVTTAATCTADGVKTYTCSQCSETKTESIAATDHSFSEAGFTWAENLSSAAASIQCHCGHKVESACTLTWDNSAAGVLSVTASAILDDKTFRERREITTSVEGDTITITLPGEIPGLTIIAAAYDSSGEMTDCQLPEMDGTSASLTITGFEIRIYFLTAGYSPLSLPMIL